MPQVLLLTDVTSRTKPEVHNVFSTPPEEDRATATGDMPKNLVKIGPAVAETCSWTDIHTLTHTHTDTDRERQTIAILRSYGGGVNMCSLT